MNYSSAPDSFIVAKRSVTELLDAGLDCYRKEFANLLKVAFAIMIPSYVLKSFAYSLDWMQLDVLFSVFAYFNFAEWNYATPLFFIIDLLFHIMIMAAVSQFVISLARPQPDSLKQISQILFRKLRALVWFNAINSIIVFAGLLACVIPGLWFCLALSLTIPLIMNEDTQNYRSIWQRNKFLLGSNWHRLIGFALLVTLMLAILTIALTFILSGIYGIIIEQISWLSGVTAETGLLNLLSGVVFSLIILPMLTVFITFFYFDLRTAKEAFDLECLIKHLNA